MPHHRIPVRRWFRVSAVVSLLATISPAPARAAEATAVDSSPVALSERRAAEAFQAYTEKNYALAVSLYLEAYAAAPSGSILYNVARIYDLKLGDRPLAMTFYRRYIADPGAQSELIVDANDRLRELREVEVTSSRLTDTGPSAPLAAKAAAGRSALPLTHETPQQQRAHWSRLRWIGVAVGALGVAGMAVGGGFGLAAMSRASAANDWCQGNVCTSQQGVDALNAAHADATLSNVGFAAGGALFLTGWALFIAGAERASPQRAQAGIHIETQVTSSALAMQLSGGW